MSTTIVRFVEGMKFVGQGKSGHSVAMDAAERVGGVTAQPGRLR